MRFLFIFVLFATLVEANAGLRQPKFHGSVFEESEDEPVNITRRRDSLFKNTDTPIRLVKRFAVGTPLAQFSPRVDINRKIPSLAVGEGPGVLPSFPEAT